MQCVILGFFRCTIEFPVDILLSAKIMSPAFIDPNLALLGKNGTCLCDCMIAWLCALWSIDITICIDETLNSPAQVDDKINSLTLINPILALNSSMDT